MRSLFKEGAEFNRYSRLVLAILALYISSCSPFESTAQSIDVPRSTWQTDSDQTLHVVPVHNFNMATTLEKKQVVKSFAHQITIDCSGYISIYNSTGSILVSTNGYEWTENTTSIPVSSETVLYITTTDSAETADYVASFSFTR